MKGIAFYLSAFVIAGFLAASSYGQGRPLFTIDRRAVPDVEKVSRAVKKQADIVMSESGPAVAAMTRLDLPLLDGKTYRAVSIGSIVRSMDDVTWHGKIDGRDDVILTFYKGHVSGVVYAGDLVYEIVPRGSKHVLAEIDQSLLPECGGSVSTPAVADAAALEPSAGVDSGDRIDVLVVYTTATKNFLGGDDQARAFAQQAIDSTNAAYANSKIRQRVNLVHAAEYVFVETGSSSTDLSTLRQNATIQGLRNTYKADLVAMIGEVTDVCGIGYLVGSPSGSEFGYTITARSCAVGNVSFAHELGHNMGSNHNPENSGSGSVFPYSFGHYVNGSYRTVMSYVNQCPQGCARRPYFSNPEIFFNGVPTGIDGTRDNARSINNTADTMANYRYSGASIGLTNFNSGDRLPLGFRRSVTWTSEGVTGNVNIQVSRDDGMTWETVLADTPNDGSEAISVWGKPTRRGRIRVASVANPMITDSSTANISIR
ncbi:MAG: M12 family metallo-peptidase [Pyrinomonadaceae bacterium]|nr:M12 family metallo-peptidase [Pyrinomonadaceae bacterium]